VAMMVGSVLPILLGYPSAYHQFFGHVGQQLHPSYMDDLRIVWRDGRFYLFLIAAGAIAAAVDFSATKSATERWRWLEVYGVPLGLAVLILLAWPRHAYYLWYVPPLLIPATLVSLGKFWSARDRVRMAPVALALVAFAPLAAFELIQDTLILSRLPPEQTVAANSAAIRSIVPRGSTIGASELWSSLGTEYHFRSPNHDPLPLQDLDYVVLWANGTRPGKPVKVNGDAQYFAEHFRLIHDNFPRQPVTLFGKPITRSRWGFGPQIYANVDRVALTRRN